jgi:hypothetical protein
VYMIASNGKQATLVHYFLLFKSQNTISPRIVMTDHDLTQINAVESVWNPIVTLCWWDILHVWRQYFPISTYPKLWEILQKWM